LGGPHPKRVRLPHSWAGGSSFIYIQLCFHILSETSREQNGRRPHSHTFLEFLDWGGTVGPKVERYACVRVSVLGGEGRDQFFENLGSDRQKST